MDSEIEIEFLLERNGDELKIVSFPLCVQLCEKFLKDVDLKEETKNTYVLSYGDACKVYEWFYSLYCNTVGKYFEFREGFDYSEEARVKMYECFQSHTGLSREKCSEGFELGLGEFVSHEINHMSDILTAMTDSETCDFVVKMRLR